MIDGFKMVRDDPRRAVQVKEMANMAGKIINSAKLQIEYATLRKETPDIEFINVKRKG